MGFSQETPSIFEKASSMGLKPGESTLAGRAACNPLLRSASWPSRSYERRGRPARRSARASGGSGRALFRRRPPRAWWWLCSTFPTASHGPIPSKLMLPRAAWCSLHGCAEPERRRPFFCLWGSRPRERGKRGVSVPISRPRTQARAGQPYRLPSPSKLP